VRNFFGSMTGRVSALLVVGVLVSATITQLLAEHERKRAYEGSRDTMVMDRSEQLLRDTFAMPPPERAAYLAATNKQGVRLQIETQEPKPAGVQSEYARTLGARLGDDYQVESLAEKPQPCYEKMEQPSMFGKRMVFWEGICESVAVRMPDGDRMRVSVVPPGPSRHLGVNYTLVITVFVLCTIALAYLVARMTIQPLQQLARAAHDLGNDINHPPLEVAGASEIRQASAAFNAMQARIRQYIMQRTQMLAAITHDLQTPLTRMRLRLEKVTDPDLKQRLLEDLSATQAMVREGLELARSMDSTEPMQAVDLDSLLESVCCDATDAGQPVTVQGRAGMALMARPLSLRRCLTNLIDNAVKYGRQASVTVERVTGAVRVRIVDQGPGLAPAELGKVFDPFYRVESSRSRESGGTGLGLTIARNIAEQHGGRITLANCPDGGLEATLILPDQAAARPVARAA
jgi:signal transduction histidine kinase